MIGGIGYGMYQSFGNYANSMPGQAVTAGASVSGNATSTASVGRSTEGMSDAQVRQLKRSGAIECETCKSRKYQDGSNESDVSFKSPGHISPASSGALVRAHEQQHVANAYQKAGEGNGKVVAANVKLETSVCPECGRSYVAGGTTSTVIKYNESNPYGKAAKSVDAANLIGRNIDYTA